VWEGPGAFLLTRLVTVALWLLVVLGAAAGISAHLFPPAPPAAAPLAAEPASPTAPEGFAELFVQAYLAAGRGTEDSLRPYMASPPPLTQVTPGAVQVASTATVASRQVSPGYWSVTVAAHIPLRAADRPPGSAAGAPAPRFFQVGVVVTPAGMTVTSLPAEVGPPAAAGAVPLAFGAPAIVAPDHDLGAAISRFAAAFLTGDGELDRYVTAGSGLRPIVPAPYASVRLATVAMATAPATSPAGPLTRVLAEVHATDAGGRAQVLQYSLGLTQRNGRWEVADVAAAPPLAPPAGGGGGA
ncbi:MAG: conjugal transfer protein, partial [Acidimicrobiales bacterium]